MEQISGCQAVERAITILELFDEHRTVVGVGDAAKALGVHRSTASRLMATLERRGLLEQAEGSASYRLGLGLVPLAGYVLNRFPVRAQAGQVLRELRDATGETAWLGVLTRTRSPISTRLPAATSPSTSTGSACVTS
jgi:DNA-binding IclR family transcriptional regulator